MISKVLKEYRLKEGKTQKDMAEILKISRSTYNNYEQNIADPNIETLIKLADYFHTTVDALVDHQVPYLLDRSTLSNEQNILLDDLITLDREQCLMASAYIEGLKVGKAKREETISRLKGDL